MFCFTPKEINTLHTYQTHFKYENLIKKSVESLNFHHLRQHFLDSLYISQQNATDLTNATTTSHSYQSIHSYNPPSSRQIYLSFRRICLKKYALNKIYPRTYIPPSRQICIISKVLLEKILTESILMNDNDTFFI